MSNRSQQGTSSQVSRNLSRNIPGLRMVEIGNKNIITNQPSLQNSLLEIPSILTLKSVKSQISQQTPKFQHKPDIKIHTEKQYYINVLKQKLKISKEQKKVFLDLQKPESVKEYLGDYFKYKDQQSHNIQVKQNITPRKNKNLKSQKCQKARQFILSTKSSSVKQSKKRIQTLFKNIDQDSTSLKLQEVYVAEYEKEKMRKIQLQNKIIDKIYQDEIVLKRFHEKIKVKRDIDQDFKQQYMPTKKIITYQGLEDELKNKLKLDIKFKRDQKVNFSMMERQSQSDQKIQNVDKQSHLKKNKKHNNINLIKQIQPLQLDYDRLQGIIYDGQMKKRETIITPQIAHNQIITLNLNHQNIQPSLKTNQSSQLLPSIAQSYSSKNLIGTQIQRFKQKNLKNSNSENQLGYTNTPKYEKKSNLSQKSVNNLYRSASSQGSPHLDKSSLRALNIIYDLRCLQVKCECINFRFYHDKLAQQYKQSNQTQCGGSLNIYKM